MRCVDSLQRSHPPTLQRSLPPSTRPTWPGHPRLVQAAPTLTAPPDPVPRRPGRSRDAPSSSRSMTKASRSLSRSRLLRSRCRGVPRRPYELARRNPVLEARRPAEHRRPSIRARSCRRPVVQTMSLFFTRVTSAVLSWQRRAVPWAHVVSSIAASQVRPCAWSRALNFKRVLSNGVREWVAPPGCAVKQSATSAIALRSSPEEPQFDIRARCARNAPAGCG